VEIACLAPPKEKKKDHAYSPSYLEELEANLDNIGRLSQKKTVV
jgi:hypothetical protein